MAAFAVGEHGPWVSNPLPIGSELYLCDYAKGTKWPSEKTVTLAFEVSYDGGDSWRFDFMIELPGGTWFDIKKNKESTSGQCGVTIKVPNSKTMLRMRIIAEEPCEIGCEVGV